MEKIDNTAFDVDTFPINFQNAGDEKDSYHDLTLLFPHPDLLSLRRYGKTPQDDVDRDSVTGRPNSISSPICLEVTQQAFLTINQNQYSR